MTAVLGYDTIMDVVNEYTSLDAKGQYVYAAKVLARKCPLMQRLPMVASNQILSNIGTRESYLPTPGTRRFNEYISPTTSHVTPFTDPIAMVEDYSKVDWNLWKIQNDPNAWRAQKDSRKIEALTQKMETLMLYGNIATDPGAFNGLCTRFNSLTYRPNSDTTWPYNVVGAGGSGSDTTSVLVLQLGPGMVYGIYPKNMPGGLNIQDKGQVTDMITDTTVKYMEVLMTHFQWFLGLVVEDERCVQRYTNIEVSGTSNIFDEDTLITCINNLPDRGVSPGTVILAGRKICNTLDIRAKDKNNVNYGIDTVWGGTVTMFRGIPVLMAEKLSETETVVA
jgi:hypothetical protein